LIFSISQSLDKASKVSASTFIGLSIWERRHIEEWVRSNPEILGEDLLVVSIEFDRFNKSSDRLDLLAVDRQGNLVVVELKRDSAAGYADLQAIRYAAMVSSMTIDKLIPYYIGYKRAYDDEALTDLEAREQIIEFVESDSFAELSTKPRIILCSEGFSQEVTATVLWLRDSGIDISCVSITPYKVDEKVVIVPRVIIPLQEARQYLIDIKQKEDVRESSGRKARPKTMKILLDNNLVSPGEELQLKNLLPTWVKYDPTDPTFKATITGKRGQSDAIVWAKDGQEYAVSALAWKIFKDLHPENKNPGGINGNGHWVRVDGKSLWEVAEDFLEKTG
jgi:hypothetical protein